MRPLAFALLLAVISAAPAAEAPLPEQERHAMLATFRANVEALTTAIARAPRETALYSRRGDNHLFLGHFADAVADFERTIALDPAEDAPHWRLGIAYYFDRQFAKSARQFEKYHAHDGGDRENGIWKFLADVNVLGVVPARRAMLVYTRFDREPFPALYEMFAGTRTTADVFADVNAKGLGREARVVFFANYYAGLHEDVLGHRDQALALLGAAVGSAWGRTAEAGPAYMWQAARLHYETLAAQKR